MSYRWLVCVLSLVIMFTAGQCKLLVCVTYSLSHVIKLYTFVSINLKISCSLINEQFYEFLSVRII